MENITDGSINTDDLIINPELLADEKLAQLQFHI